MIAAPCPRCAQYCQVTSVITTSESGSDPVALQLSCDHEVDWKWLDSDGPDFPEDEDEINEALYAP